MVGKETLEERIENDFQYHAPKPGQQEKYTEIRAHAKALAMLLVKHCPHRRELMTALTKVEEAVMHANAAIARGG